MYLLSEHKVTKLEAITFKSLGIDELKIEEIIRTNIELLCDEDESMLIVGKQIQNEKGGRSDLTAIDQNGNIVLIELKRDKDDIERR